MLKIPKEHLQALYTLLSLPKDEKRMALLLHDLLTPSELSALAKRWQLIQMLHTGTPQREIARKLKLSISKITRGSRVLQDNTGFRHFLRILKKKGQ